MPRKGRSSDLFRKSGVFLLIGGIDVILQSGDILTLGFIVTSDQIAVYRISVVLAGILSLPLSAAGVYAMPKIAAATSLEEIDVVRGRCVWLARYCTILTIVCFLILVVSGDEIMALLYGEEFGAGYWVLLIFGASSCINVAMGLNRAMLTMLGFEQVVFKVMGICAVGNVVFNIPLILAFGIEGAAVGTATAVLCWNIWLHYECRKRFGSGVAIFSKG